MIYALLGDLEIGHDGRCLDLPAGRTLTVLAALLVHANHPVPQADLLQAAWGSTAVDPTQLYKAIAALRAMLARIGRKDALVTRTGLGYELRVPPGELDMLAFGQHIRDAEAARAGQRPEQEMARLREALALWRGPRPLAGVPAGVLRPERRQLEQRRRRAAERLFDLEIATGGLDRIRSELDMMAGWYPADARLCEQLMIAAYRCGDAAGAEDSYERHAAALASETGGTPGPALRSLRYAIGSGDEPAVAAALAAIVRRAGLLAAAPAAAADSSRQPPAPRRARRCRRRSRLRKRCLASSRAR